MPSKWKPTIICPHDGYVVLTQEQYRSQMLHANSFWICPICYHTAEWDDDCLDEEGETP